jgi:hypothetical protein
MLLIEELAVRIDNDGIGRYSPDDDTGDVYLGVLPGTPTDIVSLFPRGGAPANPPLPYEEVNASVQIIVRSVSRLGGFARGQSIIDSLNGTSGALIVDGMTVIDCMAQQAEPVDIGIDDAGLFEWSINLSIDYYKK